MLFILTDLYLLLIIALGMNVTVKSKPHPKMGNLSFDSALLLQFVKNHILPPPQTSESYNLVSEKRDMYSRSYIDQWKRNKAWRFINQILKLLFTEDKKIGFYLDIGALDGEFQCHSLFLEKELGWQGLLVEPNKVMFQLMQKKKRKAYTSNLCVGKNSYSYSAILQYKLPRIIKDYVVRVPVYGTSSLMLNDEPISAENEDLDIMYYQKVDCIPLDTLFKAIGQRLIDVVILDVNGIESEIMESFSLGKSKVDVWIIRHLNRRMPYPPESFDFHFIHRFATKGYRLFAIGYDQMDYIFIHRKASVFEKAFQNRPENWSQMVKGVEDFYALN